MPSSASGETARPIDLWCNSIEGQIVVIDGTINVMTGAKTDRQCDSRACSVTRTCWRRCSRPPAGAAGDVVTLRGAKTLRFRQPTG